MPGGPKLCALFLTLYHTPFATELKINTTDAVTARLLTIYYRADYPKPRHCCKTFGCFDSSTRVMCCDFRKNNGSSQPNTAAGHYAEIVTGRYFSIVAR